MKLIQAARRRVGSQTRPTCRTKEKRKMKMRKETAKARKVGRRHFSITYLIDRDSIHIRLAFHTEDILRIEFNLMDIYAQFSPVNVVYQK